MRDKLTKEESPTREDSNYRNTLNDKNYGDNYFPAINLHFASHNRETDEGSINLSSGYWLPDFLADRNFSESTKMRKILNAV